MKNLTFLIFIIVFSFSCSHKSSINLSHDVNSELTERLDYALVIHGGAGYIDQKSFGTDKEREYRMKLDEALEKGKSILASGGTALDAVTETIIVLENSPLFNAGKGAVFAHSEKNEMDASIMTGQDQDAGAVSGVTTVKNPIMAARMVMEKSKHVLLSGEGADRFADEQGCIIVEPAYFKTKRSWETLQSAIEDSGEVKVKNPNFKFGTVGCVALDMSGNIAAGTSTGGMTNKKHNRIGDSPIIGAGTYADNATCGISCTGHGEFFIRYAVAHDIAARMEYKGISINQAAEEVVMDKLVEKGGAGGVIGLDRNGQVMMVFNTSGMFRGYVTPAKKEVKLFRDK